MHEEILDQDRVGVPGAEMKSWGAVRFIAKQPAQAKGETRKRVESAPGT